MDMRKALEGIFYVMRTGTQWKALPREFGPPSSVHRYFRYRCGRGFFQSLWVAGLERYDGVRGIRWDWLSADGCMTKAPPALRSVGNNPAGRGKKRKQAASSC
jgi:transposase